MQRWAERRQEHITLNGWCPDSLHPEGGLSGKSNNSDPGSLARGKLASVFRHWVPEYSLDPQRVRPSKLHYRSKKSGKETGITSNHWCQRKEGTWEHTSMIQAHSRATAWDWGRSPIAGGQDFRENCSSGQSWPWDLGPDLSLQVISSGKPFTTSICFNPLLPP